MAKTNKKTKKPTGAGICKNRRASHDYLLDDKTECGMSLLGWEVKSIRMGKAQLVDAYVIIHQGEAWLHGANITPGTQQGSSHGRKTILHFVDAGS